VKLGREKDGMRYQEAANMKDEAGGQQRGCWINREEQQRVACFSPPSAFLLPIPLFQLAFLLPSPDREEER